ncbi:hypothetical protein Tco_1438168 [Tanacetum coccineum]
MVLQLTDFTSEITDEELREFTSEYYIPSALHPEVPAASASIADFPVGKVGVYTRFFEFANQRVPLSLFMCNVLNHYRLHISQLHCIGAAKITNFEVNCRLLAIHPTVHLFRAFYHTSWANGWVSFSKRAGRLQCYTEKLDALRRWREMFFWVDDALVPWDFAFYTQGSLPRDERPPPGSYSMEDAELINENRIPINAYSEAFLCHMGISRNYFQSPEEVPTFIGDDGRGGCLSFLLPRLVVPKAGDREGVPFIRMVRSHCWESYQQGAQWNVVEQPEVESTDVLAPTPLSQCTRCKCRAPLARRQQAVVLQRMLMSAEVRFEYQFAEEETWMHTQRLLLKEVTETPPPNSVRQRLLAILCAGVTHLRRQFDMVTSSKSARCVAPAESQRFSVNAETESRNLARKNWHCLSRVAYERCGKSAEYKASVTGLVSGGDVGRRRRISYAIRIEYDEVLLPSHVVAIVERSVRWNVVPYPNIVSLLVLELHLSFKFSHPFLIRRKEAVEAAQLHEKKLLTVPAAQVPGYNDNAYEELVAAMEAMKLLELPHIAQLERDQDYPIDVIMAGLTLARHATEGAEAQPDYFLKPDVAQLQVPIFARPRDILNPFALEKEIPLKESLEAHAIRLAKKKGVLKGGRHIIALLVLDIPPFLMEDGVPVSVATVSPKDSELLGKLEEAGDAAYQVGSSGPSRCHSI